MSARKNKEMFLETLAKHILLKDGNDLGKSCFVFPNRRSGLFFKRFLLKHSSGTSWAPEIITINELMQEISGIAQADPLDLLFTVYDSYLQKVEFPESFDSFYPWGEMMLSDFDNLDKYLVEPEAIFRNIRELKEIDDLFGDLDEEHVAFIRKFWKSFHQGESTKEKDMFLSTWKLLPLIYRDLKEKLKAKDEGYEGLIYRRVAEMDISELSQKLKYGHYYFVGFNALSSSEKCLFSALQNKHIVSFYWDYDLQYIDNESMEAGRFLRENLLKYPPPDDLGIFNGLQNEREIRIFDLPSDVLQAKTVHQILSSRIGEIKEANDTAIIACNENLLMPILVSLPEQVDMVNITMGYPFSNTPLNSFIEAVLRVHRNVRTDKAGLSRFYHKDVLSVLNHQYYKLISSEDPAPLVSKIISENRVYISAGFFEHPFTALVFRELKNVDELCSYLEELLRFILARLNSDSDKKTGELEKEYVLVMLGRLNKLIEITQGRKDLEKETFMRFFKRIISNLRIPFSGEPLAGLQIMGILETRLLDFDNVIMLSVNEDVMPKSSAGHSFIPFSMRYAYGLPTREEMDAIYAYYFYRVIQRAKNVDLLYKSASEGIKSGEMSRYLYQVKYDLGAKMIRPVLPVTSSEKRKIHIEKTPEVLKVLHRYLAGDHENKYLSPSALNTYIECSLKFYFRKIVNVKEQDELLEELDAIGFGNILHKTIHRLYQTFKENKILLGKEDLELLAKGKNIDHILLEEFRKEYFKSDKPRQLEGRNLIIFAILKKYLLKIIETDSRIAPLQFTDLEEDYHSVRDISVGGAILEVQLGGQIDRVDRLGEGLTRIIDYKTGRAETTFESLASLFDSEHSGRSKEAFQAFVYASFYLEKNPGHIVQPGLYVVRQLFANDYSPEFKMGAAREKKHSIQSFNEYLEEFDVRLKSLLEDLFNPELAFTQTSDTDRCKYCDFNGICQRT